MSVLDHAAGYPMELEEHAAGILAGGIANNGYQCGMLWGMALAAGAQAYRRYGPGLKAETAALIAAQKMVPSFRNCNKNKEINCMGIINMNLKEKMSAGKIISFIFTGKVSGMIGCLTTMAGKSAKTAFRDTNELLSSEIAGVPAAPVSCSALLAQKMGASEIHVVMAAGLAGGIGLCGGSCGALGTALWLNELKHSRENAGTRIDPKKAGDMVNKFLKASDYRFECSEIAGRRFESPNDHAAYLRGGGCGEIIETLAASAAQQ